MPKVDLITTRFGGPTHWAQALSRAAQGSPFSIRVHSHAARTLLSPLWSTADLVHTVLPIPWHLWRAPMLLTVKGDYRVEKKIWRKMYPLAIRQARYITVPSKFLQEKLHLTQARVIPNAIDLQVYNAHQQTAKEHLELLTVTKFWFRDKAEGVVSLARNVAKAMHGLRRPYRLTILGEGPYLPSVVQRVKAMSIPATFTGAANPKPYYEHADIFLYYSLHDNMPNTVLEAMASGLPILSNAVGAIPEMIQHGRDGFIANTDNEYIDSMRQLVKDTELRGQLGAAARKRAKNDFSWSKILEQFLDLYQEMLH